MISFRAKYLPRQDQYLSSACEYTYRSDGLVPAFFDLDEQACVNGYATIGDRIAALYKNRELLDDTPFYLLEKKSCKDFRSYVNLCVYVDGSLKSLVPTDLSRLPKIEFTRWAKISCDVKGDGLTQIMKDLRPNSSTHTQNIYQYAIEAARSRMPASTSSVSNDCQQIRNSYGNFRCERFEGIRDEDPILITEDEMHKRRLQIHRSDLLAANT